MALNNLSKRGAFSGLFARGARVGPTLRDLLAPSTIERLRWEAKSAEWKPYRPKTLEAIHKYAEKFE